MQNHRFLLTSLFILLLVPLCFIMPLFAGVGLYVLLGLILCSIAIFIYRWKMEP